MPFFRKKPVVIEAHQWFKNGDHPEDQKAPNYPDTEGPHEGLVVRYFRSPVLSGDKICPQCRCPYHEHGWIETLEGGQIVCHGDWIITGVQGERSPCKPDIFEKTYEPVATRVMETLKNSLAIPR